MKRIIFIIVLLSSTICYGQIEGTANFTWDAPVPSDNLYGYRIWIFQGDAEKKPDTILRHDVTKSHYDWDIPSDMTVNVRVYSLSRTTNDSGDIFIDLGGFVELLDISALKGTKNPPTGLKVE